MSFVFLFLVDVRSGSYGYLLNLGELLWYCAFFGGWGWHSMTSFNLMPFDLQLCIMFLYYSFDSSPCRSPLSLAYLSGTPLGQGVKRLFSFPCSIYLLFSFTSWGIYLALSSAKSLQSCPALCDPINGSPPGSPVPGILQARTLKWVAIPLSNAWKWKVKVKSLSRVGPSAIPWTAAFQAPPSTGFSRQEYWSGLPLPSSSFIFYLPFKILVSLSVSCFLIILSWHQFNGSNNLSYLFPRWR